MATTQRKISELPVVGTPDDADEFEVNQGGVSKKTTRAQIRGDLVDAAGAEVAAQSWFDGLPGSPKDATGCLQANGEIGLKNPVQVSGGEITAGTETALRSYSPADILSFITTHAPGDVATSPFSNATGSQSGADSGKSWKLTGNVTDVPITNGWIAKFVNTSGSSKTITPASGTVIMTEDGTTPASVTLGNNKSCVVQGDGTNLIVDGDVT